MPFSYSFDEESYSGEYDTREEAAQEAFTERPEAESCYVGESKTPIPENYFTADDIIEVIQNQDDFLGEWAEDWPEANKEQRAELTEQLRSVFSAWLDKHNLRPSFFNVVDSEKVIKQQPSI